MEFDLKLTLGWNAIEASTTRLTVNGYYGKSVASPIANAMEESKYTGVLDFFLLLSRFFA